MINYLYLDLHWASQKFKTYKDFLPEDPQYITFKTPQRCNSFLKFKTKLSTSMNPVYDLEEVNKRSASSLLLKTIDNEENWGYLILSI